MSAAGSLRPTVRLGALLALASFALALISILLPSRHDATRVVWPAGPSADAGGPVEGGRAWLPLLLSEHRAARIAVATACPADPSAPVTLFTTRQRPESTDGIRLVQADGALRLLHGPAVLAEAAASSSCAIGLTVEGRSWTLERDGSEIGRGRLEDAPVVSGLGRDVGPDGSLGAGFSATVDSRPGGTTPSTTQLLLRIAASATAVSAVVAAVGPRRGRRRIDLSRGIVGVLGAARPVDAVVVSVMVIWGVVGPVLYDDGWVLSTVENGRASGDFSSYFEAFGAILPFGWIHDTLLLLVARVSSSLLSLRLLGVVAGLITWCACRVAVSDRPHAARGRLSMAAVFLLFWCGWGNTLRPEPLVAAAGAVVLVSVQRFLPRPRVRWLAVAGTSAGLSSTLHPDGLVAWSPLVVALPAVVAYVRALGRAERWKLATAAVTAATLSLLALFADSDLASWTGSRALFEADGAHGETWRSEIARYTLLFQPPYGVAVRRASVLLAGIAAVLHLTRRGRSRLTPLDVPAASLLVAPFVLLVTPSKWPWHFGTLTAFAATAVAIEVVRASDEGTTTPGAGRRIFAVAASATAAAVAWHGTDYWHPLALRRSALGHGGEGLLSLDASSPVVWVLAIAACAAVARAAVRRRSEADGRSLLDTMATGGVAVVAWPLLVATVALFVVDVQRAAPTWSLGLQNVRSVVRSTCGLAGDLTTADLRAAVALEEAVPPSVRDVAAATPADAGQPLAAASDRALPGHPVAVAPRAWSSYVTGDDDLGWFASPWYAVDRPRAVGVLVAGNIGSTGNRLLLQHRRRGEIRTVRAAVSVDADGWAFVRLDVPEDTTAIRLVGVDATAGRRGWLAFSSLIEVPTVRLAELMDRPAMVGVVAPEYRPYLPCGRKAVVDAGVAERPDLVVSDGTIPFLETSPFRQLGDATTLVVLPAALDGKPVPAPFELVDAFASVAPPARSARIGSSDATRLR